MTSSASPRSAPSSPPDGYAPRRPFRELQAVAFDRAKDAPVFALQMGPRCGKSKVVVDAAARRFLLPPGDPRRIDALLVVVMPSGGEISWTLDERPDDLLFDLLPSISRLAVAWDAGKFGTKKFRERLEELIAFPGLAVLAVNGEAIITENFRKFGARFLRARRVLAVGDETTLIMKSPPKRGRGSKKAKGLRSQVMHNVADRFAARDANSPGVVARMILDGTMHGENPLDLWSQYRFLSPDVLGPSFWAYKSRVAVLEETYAPGARTFKKVVGFADEGLAWIRERTDPITFRCELRDMRDLPEKVYSKRRFALSDEQRRVYDRLAEEYEAELSTGEVVSAAMVLTRWMRLQQIASNYWPARAEWAICEACAGDGCPACGDLGAREGKAPLLPIDPKRNPRIEALAEEFRLSPLAPTIVWARFVPERDAIERLARDFGRRPVRIDGTVDAEAKHRARRAFRDGDADLVVASARSAGRVYSMTRGELQVYYSNDFSLLGRLQSEDRTEGGERETGTSVVDLVAIDTKDDEIVAALRAKRRLADAVTGRKSDGRFL